MQDSLQFIIDKGATLLAVSPEIPENVTKTVEKTKASYSILYDDGMKIMKAYDVEYELPENTITRYRNGGIDIEKSNDGFNFYPIGSLPARNVSGIQSYFFIDNNATNKKQFYRLKIKGITGQVDHSNIQQLQNNGATEILVFPNPTTDVLQLQLNNTFDKMNVRIINSNGQIVKQMQLAATNQTISIPVQSLATGKYWLQLQSGDERQVLQFVKQ